MHTDHATIRYLMNKPVTLGQIMRWLLLLQEFDITIVDFPGKDNVVAYFLSRLENDTQGEPVEDSFLDEHIFAISTHVPWYVDIANYLSIGKVPQHFPYTEWWKIIHHSSRYTWIEGFLFYTGPDQLIQCCIGEDGIYDVLKAAHDGPCGGNFVDKRTGHKVLQMGYYWPTIFQDSRKYV